MNENITQTSEQPDQPSLLAMQAGLAILDLLAALKPDGKAERHTLRTRLQTARQNSKATDWFHQQLIDQMLEELLEPGEKESS